MFGHRDYYGEARGFSLRHAGLVCATLVGLLLARLLPPPLPHELPTRSTVKCLRGHGDRPSVDCEKSLCTVPARTSGLVIPAATRDISGTEETVISFQSVDLRYQRPPPSYFL